MAIQSAESGEAEVGGRSPRLDPPHEKSESDVGLCGRKGWAANFALRLRSGHARYSTGLVSEAHCTKVRRQREAETCRPSTKNDFSSLGGSHGRRESRWGLLPDPKCAGQ